MSTEETSSTVPHVYRVTLQPNHPTLHKVHIYLEYPSVCPLVGIGTAPPPLPQASAVYPQRGGGTLVCGIVGA
jgi:hypothetical protein